MAKQTIVVGTGVSGSGGGDKEATIYAKITNNFNELYAAVSNLASQSPDGLSTSYIYTTDESTGVKIRMGSRDGMWVVDKSLTPTGFIGVENTDWENVTGAIL